MKTFMVERDLMGISMADLHGMAATSKRQATRLRDEGDMIFYLGSTYLPDEGTCLCLYEARSAETVALLNTAGRLPVERIRPAVTLALSAVPIM